MFEQTEEVFLKEMNCLLKDDKTEQAIKQMNQSGFKDNVEVLKILGNAYIRVEEYALALQTFQFLSSFELDEPEKRWVTFNLGIILRKTGQIDQAKKILLKLIKDYPEDASYLCELGNCYFDSKEFDFAEKYFLEAIKNIENADCNHNKDQIYSYAAWFFKETERFEIAIKLYKKALSFFPTHKDYLLYLGDCYEELEKSKMAKKFYLKVKEYYPADYMVQEYVEQKLNH